MDNQWIVGRHPSHSGSYLCSCNGTTLILYFDIVSCKYYRQIFVTNGSNRTFEKATNHEEKVNAWMHLPKGLPNDYFFQVGDYFKYKKTCQPEFPTVHPVDTQEKADAMNKTRCNYIKMKIALHGCEKQ